MSYWFWLAHQRSEIRHEVRTTIKETVRKTDLVLLKFSTAELISPHIKWKHSKEFWYQDQMYDIIDTEIKNDSIYYWCWEDNAENQLNKKMDQMIVRLLGTNPTQNQQRNSLTRLGRSLFVDIIPNFNLRPQLFFSKSNDLYLTDLYRKLNDPVPTPPPEFYFVFS